MMTKIAGALACTAILVNAALGNPPKKTPKYDPLMDKKPNAPTSVLRESGLSALPPIDSAEFLKAFGVTINGGRVTVRTQGPAGKKPKLVNFLEMNGIQPDLALQLYKMESCGPRAYQGILIESETNKAESLGLFYSCKSECFGLVGRYSQTEKAISPRLPLPEDVCKAYYGGMVKLEKDE